MDNLNQPLISIIVPCYNGASFLKETLDCVVSQTCINWECIIVDNGSTDNSKQIAESYSHKDTRFVSVSNSNKGVSAARNAGIKMSKGKYLLPLDADDKIASSYIEKAISILEKNQNIKIVYCEAEFFGASSGKWFLPDYSLKRMLIENIIFCSGVFRKTDFDKTNEYNEIFVTGFEDWDFWLSLLSNGGDVYRIPETLFYYRIRKDSRNHLLDEEKQRNIRKQVYENHKELYAAHFNMPDLIFDYYIANSELEEAKRSSYYKLGKKLLSPYHSLKSFFLGK